MARRRPRKMATAETKLLFNLNPNNDLDVRSGINGTFVDLAQCFSLVNRVFKRQGEQFMVESIEIGVQSGGAFEATVSRLPEHWPCVNAWVKTMSLWKQQQDDRVEDSGLETTRSRYHDFKVFFDSDHADAGVAANLLPSGFYRADPASTTEYYDWDASQVVVPNAGAPGNTAEYYLHMLGPDNGAVSRGMINAYAESRHRPFAQDPNIVDVPLGGLFGTMFDVGDDSGDIITNFQDNNKDTPYLIGDQDTAEYYPGGSFQGYITEDTGGSQMTGTIVDFLSVNALTTLNTDRSPSFTAPCGLLKLSYNASGVALPGVEQPGDLPMGFWMVITLVPGMSKGIMTRPMQEVN